MNNERQILEMPDIKDLFAELWRQRTLVVIIAALGSILGGVLALGRTSATPETYTATHPVLIQVNPASTSYEDFEVVDEAVMANELAIATSPGVIDDVVETLGYVPSLPSGVAASDSGASGYLDNPDVRLEYSIDTSSRTLLITATSTNPTFARDSGAAAADGYIAARIADLASTLTRLQSMELADANSPLVMAQQELDRARINLSSLQERVDSLNSRIAENDEFLREVNSDIAEIVSEQVPGGDVVTAAALSGLYAEKVSLTERQRELRDAIRDDQMSIADEDAIITSLSDQISQLESAEDLVNPWRELSAEDGFVLLRPSTSTQESTQAGVNFDVRSFAIVAVLAAIVALLVGLGRSYADTSVRSVARLERWFGEGCVIAAVSKRSRRRFWQRSDTRRSRDDDLEVMRALLAHRLDGKAGSFHLIADRDGAHAQWLAEQINGAQTDGSDGPQLASPGGSVLTESRSLANDEAYPTFLVCSARESTENSVRLAMSQLQRVARPVSGVILLDSQASEADVLL